jgi:hypothetical protein
MDGPLEDIVEGAEDFRAASDAYVYGYPLVTMELTRRVITNVAKVEGTRGTMGEVIKMRAYPDATFATSSRQRRHALYDVLFRCWRGALGVEDLGHERALFPAALPGWLDQCLCRSGQPHHGDRRADLRCLRAGLVRRDSRGHDGTEIADRDRLASRAHLLHRDARRLRHSPCASGRVQAAAAQHMGQGLHAPCRQGRCRNRHEDGGA